jgi:hypothetical protein
MPGSTNRAVSLTGTADAVAIARQLIVQKVPPLQAREAGFQPPPPPPAQAWHNLGHAGGYETLGLGADAGRAGYGGYQEMMELHDAAREAARDAEQAALTADSADDESWGVAGGDDWRRLYDSVEAQQQQQAPQQAPQQVPGAAQPPAAAAAQQRRVQGAPQTHLNAWG